MIYNKHNIQRGWVSLPIIALLLAISALSSQYQQRLQAGYKWRGQLHDVEEGQQIWGDFYQAWVVAADFSSAKASACVGFCDLQQSALERIWQSNDQWVYYRWERYVSVPDESENTHLSYRLCATQNQQQYRCWWWQESRLLASGWVSASG
ncbi:hypothetical protein HGG82_12445 [Marinomonas sp. M1K-6]|uniref:Uncharacterized protein n=1 Tax=Marinomonas profundi TaxID=2726122 RepID=A0A847RBQ5_9GAMM|nr:hypothetical protein [Marinomonas profundi]NLQ18424.1 hypothetical protein [Marinomonas profundi]UDV02478.1 hypothetical protein J8N69_12900 [Marinomonas profundi]